MGEEGQIFKREYSKKSFFLKILLSMIYQTRCKTTQVMLILTDTGVSSCFHQTREIRLLK